MQLKHLQRLLRPSYASIRHTISTNYSQVQVSSEQEDAREKKRQEIMARGLPKVKAIPDVKDIILVASGKGGVGKSTTAVNLATALKIEYPNKNIGLLDTDVFGPTVPQMMNLHDTPLLNDDNLMEPLVNYGVKCMSMGFLIDDAAAVIWRGLMVMQALEKLMRQVHWGPTDLLVVDTPPGTGDTLLCLAQNLPITGALLVTTPQRAAVDVTRRGAKMFGKLRVPIVGLVENMSAVRCPACRNDVRLFGDGARALAEELDAAVLVSVPLEKEIGACADRGAPVAASKPNSNEARCYRILAKLTHDYVDKMADAKEPVAADRK